MVVAASFGEFFRNMRENKVEQEGRPSDNFLGWPGFISSSAKL